MEGMSAPEWRKSSYSGNSGGNCTEVAAARAVVLVRDSKDPDGAKLAFSVKAWRAFAAKVKRSLAGRSQSVQGHSRVLRVPLQPVQGRFPLGRHGAVCA